MKSTIPGPGLFESIKYLYRIITKERSSVYLELFQKYGGIVTLKLPIRIVFVFNAEDIGKILKGNYLNYHKSASYRHFKFLVGEGLITAEGKEWKQQRQVGAKFFTQRMVHNYLEKMNFLTQKFAQDIEKSGNIAEGITVDLLKELENHTFQVITQALFHLPAGKREMRFKEESQKLEEFCVKRLFSFFRWPLWFPLKSHRQAKKSLTFINQSMHEIIAEAKNGKYAEDSFLQALIDSPLSDKTIRDEIITYLIAGHGTTNIAIAWTLFLLAKHPEKLQKAKDEINKIVQGESLNAEHIKKLHYLKNVIHESMRLYPPGPFLSRENKKDDTLSGYSIKKGAILICSQFVTHRDSRYWDEPDQFKPERFDGDIVEFSYFPFAEGPRKCLGMQFAIQEIISFLVYFLPRYDFQLESNYDGEIKTNLTLLPAQKLLFKLILPSRK